jgi:cyclopropane-fatty-acyl-phospholipid synthase
MVPYALSIFESLLRTAGPRCYRVQLWDGSALEPEEGEEQRFSVHVKSAALFARLLMRPSMATLGDAYVNGEVELRGDLLAAFEVADRLVNADPTLLRSLVHAWSVRPSLRDLLRVGAHSEEDGGIRRARIETSDLKARARDAVNFHYDLPFEFFRAWLDPKMIYSCAYFTASDDELDAAQVQKLDHICKKLRLHPGDRLLDVGCGWGALVMRAASRWGADATGITLSEKQAAEANRRIAAAGLTDRCRVRVCDYRDLPASPQFDCIASVGMIEHVREPFQARYFEGLHRLLRPRGLLLNHGITCTPSRPLRGGNVFLQRYVFPDHQLVPVSASLTFAESAGFEVRDVESLREHYALTLLRWFERLRASGSEARDAVGAATVRAFEVYLVGMAYHFQRGNLQIHQALLARPARGDAGLPLTRAHLYAHRDPEPLPFPVAAADPAFVRRPHVAHNGRR